jgi:hypothetical protein
MGVDRPWANYNDFSGKTSEVSENLGGLEGSSQPLEQEENLCGIIVIKGRVIGESRVAGAVEDRDHRLDQLLKRV